MIICMNSVSIDKFTNALSSLQQGYESVLVKNEGKAVTAETLMWSEYYIKKMLLVLADAERGKEPYDLDIDFVK